MAGSNIHKGHCSGRGRFRLRRCWEACPRRGCPSCISSALSSTRSSQATSRSAPRPFFFSLRGQCPDVFFGFGAGIVCPQIPPTCVRPVNVMFLGHLATLAWKPQKPTIQSIDCCSFSPSFAFLFFLTFFFFVGGEKAVRCWFNAHLSLVSCDAGGC